MRALTLDTAPVVRLGLGGIAYPANPITFGDGAVLAGSESDLAVFRASRVTVATIPEPFSAGLSAAWLAPPQRIPPHVRGHGAG